MKKELVSAFKQTEAELKVNPLKELNQGDGEIPLSEHLSTVQAKLQNAVDLMSRGLVER